MSGHLDGPPPGPPDPPYIPGDLGAPSAEEFARRRASTEPRPENPYFEGEGHNDLHGAWAEGYAAGKVASDDAWISGDMVRLSMQDSYSEGFAAGRAAATPDPPNATPRSELRRIAAVTNECPICHSTVIGKPAHAASPDERLREALREIVRQVEEYPALSPTGIMVRDDIAGMVEGTARAALAAADREKPKCRAPHCFSEYGTPCGTCPAEKPETP